MLELRDYNKKSELCDYDTESKSHDYSIIME